MISIIIVVYCCYYRSVGVFKNGRVEIIANDQGNRITPSYVAFTPEGERLIGDAAKNQLTTNPENTVFDVKRLIGRRYDESTVQQDIKFYPFKVTNKNNKPNIQVTLCYVRPGFFSLLVFGVVGVSAYFLAKFNTMWSF